MTQGQSTFDKQQASKGFWIFRGIAYDSKVSEMLKDMIDSFPPNVAAFDHQVAPAGERFLITVVVQTKSNSK